MRLTASLYRRVGEWSKKYANLPDSFIERRMRFIYWKTPRGKPQYLPRTVERTRLHFSVHRPWTNIFSSMQASRRYPQFVHLEPIKDWSFFRGDRVEIQEGRDKGKQGIVKDIIQERNWVIVEGLNTKLECVGKSRKSRGLYTQQEQPLLVTSQLLLVDPGDLKGTKIEWRYSETGERVRVSTRTGRVIPIPVSSEETKDYKFRNLYIEQPKDTTKDDVEEVTFEGKLKTFEMDIMDKMGIKEDRVPKKYYWY